MSFLKKVQCPCCHQKGSVSYKENKEGGVEPSSIEVLEGNFDSFASQMQTKETCLQCGLDLWENYNPIKENSALPLGTRVRLPSTGEYGLVVWNTWDQKLECWKVFVNFYGTGVPEGELLDKPYVLNYLNFSLEILNEEWKVIPQKYNNMEM